MTGHDVLLAFASAAGVAGVVTLRLAWAQARRSMPLNAAGWALLLIAIVVGWLADGAWGTSVAVLWTMGAAFVLLAWAGLRSEPGRADASNRRAGMLPESGEPLRLGGRLLTFTLVGIVPVLPSAGGGLALAALGRMLGWSEANALALAFFAMPILWMLIAYAVLMQPVRRGQVKVLAIASLPTWPTLAAGLLS
ncbi:hypothetical protein [Novosphingobium sp. fls2-241-R2A-195]|uniref:hypothetical protein n=1 Tax=Novosphingobium sp. fls2-241-R2A-195 TaxID=3040296 RepID=UPI00254DF51C|nr:hypothetical protein [Novosphingobium sp. fls2-241-R2A-195]